MITMLRAKMDKIDSIQEQLGNVSRDGNPKKVTEYQGLFDNYKRYNICEMQIWKKESRMYKTNV